MAQGNNMTAMCSTDQTKQTHDKPGVAQLCH